MTMNKFIEELIRYSKYSGAFEYAAKRVLADKSNAKLRSEMQSAYNILENVGFKAIKDIHDNNPNDADVESIYNIASVDLAYMRIIFQNI